MVQMKARMTMMLEKEKWGFLDLETVKYLS